MRIEGTSLVEHLGSVKIHGVRRVLELDSGATTATHIDEGLEVQSVGIDAIEDIQQRLAIILPIKDEDLKVFAGVLKGIPHNCLMIIVSNSQRGETDTFRSEQDILSWFCRATRRQAVIVHQKDKSIAKALEQAKEMDIPVALSIEYDREEISQHYQDRFERYREIVLDASRCHGAGIILGQIELK